MNSYTTSQQMYPVVAADSLGGFVVVWESDGSNGGDTSDRSIQGQRFAADGLPLGDEFQINTYTTDRQRNPSVAFAPDGSFIVVWSSNGADNGDPSSLSIQGQRFDSDGSFQGPQFLVNSSTVINQSRPSIAIDATGGFVVSWQDAFTEGGFLPSWGVRARVFASDGTPKGPDFQVNSYTREDQWESSVAVDALGNFVVVWESDGSNNGDQDSWSIQGRRFSADGSPIDGQFLVNRYTRSGQTRPMVVMDSSGGFVVAWQSSGSNNGDDSYTSIQGRRFSADGLPRGGQFLVNRYTPNAQQTATIALTPDDRLVAGWTSNGSEDGDSSGFSIQGRLFDDRIVFQDGFESGDLSTWDVVTQ